MNRNRWIVALLAAVLACAAPALAQQTKTARGKVVAVSSDSLTVKVRDQDMRFAVDAATKAVVEGGSRRTAAARKGGAPGPKLTDLIQVGQSVAVSYHDMGGTRHAAEVRVISKAK